MSSELLAPVFRAIDELSVSEGRALVAIDGRCASGKTWLAEHLAARLPCKVVHMDHFYLPPERRPPDWPEQPAGNMDLPRLQAEVLAPFLAGALRSYRPYNCQTGDLLPPVPLPNHPLLVLEGSYSHHPALSVPGALNIFLTCSRKVQVNRLKLREKERFPAFAERWIPMEELYYRICGIPQANTLVVETDRLFEPAETAAASEADTQSKLYQP